MNFLIVSRDTNAIRIAQKYDVDIIVSSTTMKTLAGNVAPLFKQKWEIPFSVQELPGGKQFILFVYKAQTH